MIDWITFHAPLRHKVGEGGPFFAGSIISTVPDCQLGEIAEYETLKRLPVEGSYSNRITVQSTSWGDSRQGVWVSGCPAKWFQGHNVFGSNDLPGLALEMLHRLCKIKGMEPSEEDIADWNAGHIRLSRVDVTESFDFGSLPRARMVVRSLSRTAHLRHRGAGVFKGETLYFGPKSQRWSLKVYSKGNELEARPLPLDLRESSLPAAAAGLVRFEFTLRGKYLKGDHPDTMFGPAWVSFWCDTTASEFHSMLLEGLQISEATMLDAHDLEGLPRHLLPVYNLWRDGHDLRTLYTRPTFYRHRSQLLKLGIDIAVSQGRPDDSNVVPIRTVLVGRPVSPPDWMVGTKWFFEPRQKVA